MKYHSRAIALTYLKHSETSIIAKLYTETKGLQTFIIKGVRSKNSKKKLGLFQPLQLSTITGIENKKSSLQYLSEIVLAKDVPVSILNIKNQLMCLFIAEVMSKILHENEEDQKLFQYMWDLKISLIKDENVNKNLSIAFLLDISAFLGFYPSLENLKNKYFDLRRGGFVEEKNHLCLSEANSLYLKLLLTNKEFDMPKKNKTEILNSIIKYYKLHEHELKNITSHSIINEFRK